MKCLGLFSAVALAGYGLAQDKLPTLGPPAPVDFHVTDIMWHPAADGLIYTRKMGEGNAIGVYLLGQDQGTVAVKLNKGDKSATEWLQGTSQAIAIVYRHEKDGSEPITRVQAYLMNAENGESKLLFNTPYPSSENPRLTVETSPKLLHAIFKLDRGAKSRKAEHFILKTGGNQLDACPAIDDAVARGLRGPSWSVDGTAVFSELSRFSDPALDKIAAANLLDSQAQAELALRKFEVQKTEKVENLALAREKVKVVEALLENSRWVSRPMAPPVGASVMELMPQNGILRSVRFGGEWQYPKNPERSVIKQDHRVTLDFGRSRGQSTSIWLTRRDKADEGGVLVSANATHAWISPSNRMVAYLSDNGLFIRTMK